jgi:cell division protein DivIC
LNKASNTATSYAGSKRRLKLWLAVILLFMAWALYTVVNQYQKQGETELRLAAMEQKLDESKKNTADLHLKIERLKDPEYIHQIARKQGLIMPGEKPIQVTGQGE